MGPFDGNDFFGGLFDLNGDGFLDADDYPDLDFDELAEMDEDDRRVFLEEAGYDPDDFEDEF